MICRLRIGSGNVILKEYRKILDRNRRLLGSREFCLAAISINRTLLWSEGRNGNDIFKLVEAEAI